MRKHFLSGILGAALILSLVWGFNQYRIAQNYRVIAENEHRRAFTDFAGQLDQLETDMAKGNLVTDANQRIYYLSRIAHRTDLAVQDLAELPAEEAGLNYTNEFLNKVGDYARTLAQKVASGGSISDSEEKVLLDMHSRLQPINENVQNLLVRLDTDNLAWTDAKPSWWQRFGLVRTRVAEAAAEGDRPQSTSVSSGLAQLDISLQKLPPFSYEGESSTKTVPEPLGLPKEDVNRDQALAAAKSFLAQVGYPNLTPEFAGESKGPMGGYGWKSGDVYLEVSRLGGKVIMYRDQRPIQPKTLGLDEAKRSALAALQKMGWQLALTSSEDQGSYVQFEAVPEQDGVRIYPDKVRLMVSLDNGQVIGFDATPYYAFHHTRTLNKTLTMDQALRKVRQDFQVRESRLAVIPKPGNREVLCYEFRGRSKGEEYLLYINAANGNEEQVMRIIQTPRGEYIQ